MICLYIILYGYASCIASICQYSMWLRNSLLQLPPHFLRAAPRLVTSRASSALKREAFRPSVLGTPKWPIEIENLAEFQIFFLWISYFWVACFEKTQGYASLGCLKGHVLGNHSFFPVKYRGFLQMFTSSKSRNAGEIPSVSDQQLWRCFASTSGDIVGNKCWRLQEKMDCGWVRFTRWLGQNQATCRHVDECYNVTISVQFYSIK